MYLSIHREKCLLSSPVPTAYTMSMTLSRITSVHIGKLPPFLSTGLQLHQLQSNIRAIYDDK